MGEEDLPHAGRDTRPPSPRRLMGAGRYHRMFTLDRVVPWGRSFDEYLKLFALEEGDLRRRILGCSDGPASFNAVATRRGLSVVSCDPLYQWSPGQVRTRIEATFGQVVEQARANVHEFVWETFRDVDALASCRRAAMEEFLADLEAGLREGRYVPAVLPHLPFRDGAFDLALCSHYLFLYSEQVSEAEHLASVLELCRVAREVRIFPLVALGGARSPHLERVLECLAREGHTAEIVPVGYHFQRGARELLRITRGCS